MIRKSEYDNGMLVCIEKDFNEKAIPVHEFVQGLKEVIKCLESLDGNYMIVSSGTGFNKPKIILQLVKKMETKPMVKLGQIFVTPGILEHFTSEEIGKILARHQVGDWGDVSEKDKKANDEALKNGGRLFSAYVVKGIKVWVITEADRFSTTVLLPDEY